MLGSSLLMGTGTVTPWAPLVVALPILTAAVVAVVVLASNNRDRQGAEEHTGLIHRDETKTGAVASSTSTAKTTRFSFRVGSVWMDTQLRQPQGSDASSRRGRADRPAGHPPFWRLTPTEAS
jgi:hypothetical protein